MKSIIKKPKILLMIIFLTTFISGCNNFKEQVINNNSTTTTAKPAAVEKEKNTGLLIGLSKNNELNQNLDPMKRLPNDYRTLWISKLNGKTAFSEKKNEIIAPYKDSFYKLVNSKFHMSDPKDGSDNVPSDIYKNFTYYYNFSNIISQVVDKPIKSLFTEESFRKTFKEQPEGNFGEPYSSQTDWLWYVGNNYACTMTYNYATGGGTLRSQWTDCKMYDLDNLSNLDSRKKTVSLVDLLDEKEKLKLNKYVEKYKKNLNPENPLIKSEQKIDIKNILLTRKEGRWQVSLPLYEVYQHDGNGSSGRFIKEYIPTDIKLPVTVTCYDDLCLEWSTIKVKFPDVKDAVSSPNKDMLAVLTPTKLLVFNNPEKGLDNPSLTIDVDKNESIILNQWSTGDYVEKWDKTLNNIGK